MAKPVFLSMLQSVGALLLLGLGVAADAQTACSSDDQPRPVALLERFINADCVSCWSNPDTSVVKKGQVALDWVLPGSQGDGAPLAAVARVDSLARWQTLPGLGINAKPQAVPVPARTAQRLGRVASGAVQPALRVAFGGFLGDYMGASIGLEPLPRNAATATKRQPWTASLALVETLPEGTEGSPVPRNLVRNLLQVPFSVQGQLSKQEQSKALKSWLETRSMNIPPGSNPDQLRVIGWLEDHQGRLLAVAESRCTPG